MKLFVHIDMPSDNGALGQHMFKVMGMDWIYSLLPGEPLYSTLQIATVNTHLAI